MALLSSLSPTSPTDVNRTRCFSALVPEHSQYPDDPVHHNQVMGCGISTATIPAAPVRVLQKRFGDSEAKVNAPPKRSVYSKRRPSSEFRFEEEVRRPSSSTQCTGTQAVNIPNCVADTEISTSPTTTVISIKHNSDTNSIKAGSKIQPKNKIITVQPAEKTQPATTFAPKRPSKNSKHSSVASSKLNEQEYKRKKDGVTVISIKGDDESHSISASGRNVSVKRNNNENDADCVTLSIKALESTTTSRQSSDLPSTSYKEPRKYKLQLNSLNNQTTTQINELPTVSSATAFSKDDMYFIKSKRPVSVESTPKPDSVRSGSLSEIASSEQSYVVIHRSLVAAWEALPGSTSSGAEPAIMLHYGPRSLHSLEEAATSMILAEEDSIDQHNGRQINPGTLPQMQAVKLHEHSEQQPNENQPDKEKENEQASAEGAGDSDSNQNSGKEERAESQFTEPSLEQPNFPTVEATLKEEKYDASNADKTKHTDTTVVDQTTKFSVSRHKMMATHVKSGPCVSESSSQLSKEDNILASNANNPVTETTSASILNSTSRVTSPSISSIKTSSTALSSASSFNRGIRNLREQLSLGSWQSKRAASPVALKLAQVKHHISSSKRKQVATPNQSEGEATTCLSSSTSFGGQLHLDGAASLIPMPTKPVGSSLTIKETPSDVSAMPRPNIDPTTNETGVMSDLTTNVATKTVNLAGDEKCEKPTQLLSDAGRKPRLSLWSGSSKKVSGQKDNASKIDTSIGKNAHIPLGSREGNINKSVDSFNENSKPKNTSNSKLFSSRLLRSRTVDTELRDPVGKDSKVTLKSHKKNQSLDFGGAKFKIRGSSQKNDIKLDGDAATIGQKMRAKHESVSPKVSRFNNVLGTVTRTTSKPTQLSNPSGTSTTSKKLLGSRDSDDQKKSTGSSNRRLSLKNKTKTGAQKESIFYELNENPGLPNAEAPHQNAASNGTITSSQPVRVKPNGPRTSKSHPAGLATADKTAKRSKITGESDEIDTGCKPDLQQPGAVPTNGIFSQFTSRCVSALTSLGVSTSHSNISGSFSEPDSHAPTGTGTRGVANGSVDILSRRKNKNKKGKKEQHNNNTGRKERNNNNNNGNLSNINSSHSDYNSDSSSTVGGRIDSSSLEEHMPDPGDIAKVHTDFFNDFEDLFDDPEDDLSWPTTIVPTQLPGALITSL